MRLAGSKAALAALVAAVLGSVANAAYYELVMFGGDLNTWAPPLYRSEVTTLAATSGAFGLLFDTGLVVTWGDKEAGGDIGSSTQSQINSGVTGLVATRMAFCAIKDDGSVVTWPTTYTWSGGDSSAVAADLTDVQSVYSNDWVFVAVKSGGGLVAWGDDYFGATIPDDLDMSQEVTDIVSTRRAFAVLRADGSVVTWGDSAWGGDSSGVADSLQSGVTQIVAAEGGAFAAIKDDGSVVTWGNSKRGGDSSSVQSQLVDVVSIVSTFDAFAALTELGTAVAWGDSVSGGNLRAIEDVVQRGVSTIVSNKFAFAALKLDGSVKTWGDPLYGGDSFLKGVEYDIKALYSTAFAFAALKSNGEVLTWGNEDYGGSLESVEGNFMHYFSVYSTYKRCGGGVKTTHNTLETCARDCANRAKCTYFSFNYDDTTSVEKRCTVYSDNHCKTMVNATSQTLYALDTNAALSQRQTEADAALENRNVQNIYSNDWSFFATLKSGIAVWGAADYGGSYSGTFPSGDIVQVVPSRVGYGVLLSV